MFFRLPIAATVLVAAVSAVSAASNTIFRPHVTTPKAGDVWPAGSMQTIAWDTSDIPPENKDQRGKILLGYIEGDALNEHLDVEHPLASNVSISAGTAAVQVPPVPSRDDYVVVLFGDSGNPSSKFTIS